MSNKKIWLVVIGGGGVILLLTFAKLLWVTYFSASNFDGTMNWTELVKDTLPLFVLAVLIGTAVAWFRHPKE